MIFLQDNQSSFNLSGGDISIANAAATGLDPETLSQSTMSKFTPNISSLKSGKVMQHQHSSHSCSNPFTNSYYGILDTSTDRADFRKLHIMQLVSVNSICCSVIIFVSFCFISILVFNLVSFSIILICLFFLFFPVSPVQV